MDLEVILFSKCEFQSSQRHVSNKRPAFWSKSTFYKFVVSSLLTHNGLLHKPFTELELVMCHSLMMVIIKCWRWAYLKSHSKSCHHGEKCSPSVFYSWYKCLWIHIAAASMVRLTTSTATAMHHILYIHLNFVPLVSCMSKNLLFMGWKAAWLHFPANLTGF